MGDYKKRRKKYDDDDYDDDDRYERRSRDKRRKISIIERILTPGTATNNVIKTAATGIIAGGTVLLMGIYGILGSRLEGATYLPMATAVCSAVATACVWIFGRPKAEVQRNAEISELNREIRGLNHTIEALQSQFNEVDKRLANVEVLESFEDRLARKELDRKISSTLPKYEKEESVAESSFMSSSSETE